MTAERADAVRNGKCMHQHRKNSRVRITTRNRRGSVLVYSLALMAIMFGFVSFGVDFGHIQTVKTEMQRDADAVARGALQMYLTYGSSTAVAYAPLLAGNTYNPVDVNSGTASTITVTWGSWNADGKIFTPGGSSPVAVKVMISRTVATGNPGKADFPADERFNSR